MELPRRRILRLGGAAVLTGLASSIASPALAELVTRRSRNLALQNLHTGETVNVDYWANGNYIPEALAEINKVMRDWRSGEIHAIEPRLLDSLSYMRNWMGRKDAFHVISGYRSPTSNAKMASASSGVAKKSLHMEGKAIDIRLPGCELSSLHKAALSMRCGGVGYYPVSNFVHLDVGRVRNWSGA